MISLKRFFLASCIVLLALALFFPHASPAAEFVPPVIEHPDADDVDGNLIFDRLEKKVSSLVAEKKKEQPVRIEVVLYEPYTDEDLDAFRAKGGTVIHTFEKVSYGFAGAIPANKVAELARVLKDTGKLCVIADDPEGKAHLDYSAQHVRARTAEVWGSDYLGNGDTTIAILDTGLDDSHLDFSGHVSAGWIDTTTDNYANNVDYNGHGSHVAGIATGSGDSYGTGFSGMYVVFNESYTFPSDGSGYLDVVEVMNTGSNQLSIHLYWDGSGTTQISSKDPSWSWMSYQNSSSSPNSLSYNITTTGVYRPYFGNQSGASGSYCGLVSASYNPPGDGHFLFQGMASKCKVLGVKVLKDDGTGNSTDFGEGLDWCVTNRDTYNIRVINLSLGLNEGNISSTLDAKVNNVVANGIVVVCSAGNSYPTYTIPSPGNAAKAITIGAINDDGAMTNYSSNGFSGQDKPDAVAPGGSMVAGTEISSVETNDGDAFNTQSDHNADNYANLHGTSMSAPMVSGLAGLLIDVQEDFGDTWDSTQEEVLAIKNIILMTATETNKNGEYEWNGGNEPDTPSGNDPSLDRGSRDLVEGFGRINTDAAIEATTVSIALNSSGPTKSLGSTPLQRKAMAANVAMVAGTTYDIRLVCESGSLDCDLYIYDIVPDSDGNPIILTSATNASTGTSESIFDYTATYTGTHYLVGKYVSGTGTGDYHFEFAEHTSEVDNWFMY